MSQVRVLLSQPVLLYAPLLARLPQAYACGFFIRKSLDVGLHDGILYFCLKLVCPTLSEKFGMGRTGCLRGELCHNNMS